MSVVFYALGAGSGHLRRALLLTTRAELRGAGAVSVLHQCDRVDHVEIPEGVRLVHVPRAMSLATWTDELAKALEGAATLVVDTFPAGIAHELGDALLRPALRTILVRRYMRPDSYDDYEELCRRYDEVWSPYPEEGSENEDAFDNERFIGHVVRRIPIGAEENDLDLCVLGARASVPAGWRLPARTRFVHGRFDMLPRARCYLALSAGYHSSYELAAAGVSFGLVPRDKRYDDEFRRAERLGKMVLSGSDLERLSRQP